MKVKVWNEETTIPTYEIGESEKTPMFLEKRIYQGSSGVVYPYPIIEKITDKPVDKKYNAVWIENEYIKVMVLPELGGRVQMAYDKIKQRHFVYYNSVIKPALVGLTGPWISGGIEFNWPQHHRPSTYLPIDWTIEEREDGSATIWVSERERMFHQRGTAGFTLYPGCAFLEIKGHVYNPTPMPQTFLWWANPAVAVNDHYQSVFPADVNAVFDHGKRDVSSFPIATGIYYKQDYSPGTDISRYKNIPVPTSYMAIASKYNFVGGYENDTQAGVLHVANHHISPGKKQWTWGNGDFGKAWDRNLTDKDGPYIELMTGVYTDNQPDFTWLQPYEEKNFEQYFIPYREIGIVKNATKDFLLNVEVANKEVVIKVLATSTQNDVNIVIKSPDTVYYNKTHSLAPEMVFETKVKVDVRIEDMKVILIQNGKQVLHWKHAPIDDKIPKPATAALKPEDIETCEELYLNGLHLEQYRHATFDPTSYYLEALKRDPSDIRSNNAMGLWLLRRGKFTAADDYFSTAVQRQLKRNPNPYDGEPFYNWGLSLKMQGRYEEAYEKFYKACWNSAWQDSGYFSLAQISCIKRNWEEALYEIDKSLNHNTTNTLGRHLKTAILRKLGRRKEALSLIKESLELDRFNFGCLFEKYILSNDPTIKASFIALMRKDTHNYCELALDYLNSGLYAEAIDVLNLALEVCPQPSAMVYYYLGYTHLLRGDQDAMRTTFSHGSKHDPQYCFPNRLEAISVLHAAIEADPSDAKAYYYLGNLWYDKRQYIDAIECWEKSVESDYTFPIAQRNLALGYFNKLGKPAKAIKLLEQGFALDTSDTRILMELDQLYKRTGYHHSVRKVFLDRYRKQIDERDDLYLEYITLLNQLGNYREALAMIENRKFHPWEGGEGKVPSQYQIAHVELAKTALQGQSWDEALSLINKCYEYPHNFGEGKLPGAQENDFDYWKGCALEGKGEIEMAKKYFRSASQGLTEPCDAMFYNDQKPDKIFYQGLSFLKLGEKIEAQRRFERLVNYGTEHLHAETKIDYFAVSLPDMLIWEDDLENRNKTHCLYMMGLGYMGLGEIDKAEKSLQEASDLDINHQGIQIHKKILRTIKLN